MPFIKQLSKKSFVIFYIFVVFNDGYFEFQWKTIVSILKIWALSLSLRWKFLVQKKSLLNHYIHIHFIESIDNKKSIDTLSSKKTSLLLKIILMLTIFYIVKNWMHIVFVLTFVQKIKKYLSTSNSYIFVLLLGLVFCIALFTNNNQINQSWLLNKHNWAEKASFIFQQILR